MAIASNRYKLPAGYSRYAMPSKYVPWNGGTKTASPARIIVGAVQNFTVASVPADLSTFILNSPDGRSFTFQFLYAGSIQTAGTIAIPLPASGASTAAQVKTQIQSVLSLAGGTPLGGSFVSYPWTFGTISAAVFAIAWNVNGTAVASTGTQATITITATATPFFTLTPVLPARFGRNYAVLPG